MKDTITTEEEASSLIKVIEVESESKSSEIEEQDSLLEATLPKEEKVRFSLKQKIIAVLIGLVSFFIFTFVFFPYGEILKFYLNQIGKQSNFSIDFKESDISLNGKISLQSASILLGKGESKKNIKIESLELNINLWNLYINGKIIGSISMIAPDISMPNLVNIKFKSLVASVDIDNLEKIQMGRFNRINGKISLSLNAGSISDLPEIPFVGNLGDIKHKKTNVAIDLKQGNLLIKKFNNQTSLGKISVQGNILIESSIGNSILDINICPKLDKKFKTRRQDLDGMLLLIQNKSKSECLPIGGTFGNPTPKFQFPI